MAVAIRSKREIERIHEAGKIVARVLSQLEQDATVGMTTMDLAGISDAIIEDAGGKALFKGVKNAQAEIDFPSSICASVNEEVVHGIPGQRKLVDGDIVSIDCGVKLNGYCGDDRPSIIQDFRIFRTHVNHRLDRQNHSLTQKQIGILQIRTHIVGQLRVFM